MPSVAVLAGLILIVSFGMSHSNVVVDGTDWVEPVLCGYPSVCQQEVESPLCASIYDSW
jgi:hypothetical protein